MREPNFPQSSKEIVPRKKDGGAVKAEVAELGRSAPVVAWLMNQTSDRTKSTYLAALARCMADCRLQNVDELLALDRLGVQMWREHMARRGMKPRAINNRLSALSSLFADLYQKHLVASNPVQGVKRPKVASQKVVTPAFSREQVRRFLDAPDISTLTGCRDAALLHTFAYTGCRLSEPTTLRVGDFYESQGYFGLNFTVKGGKENWIAIHTELQLALRRYLAMSGHGNDKDAYLFQAGRLSDRERSGRKPLSRQSVDRIFRKYARKIGLTGAHRVHSFRATFITEALERDHPVEAVQQSVAHASVTTTLAYDQRGRHPRRSASFAVNY